MTIEEKLTLLEETIEADAGSLKPEMMLEGIDQYDSMSKLSVIVMFQDEFGKKLDNKIIRGFKTVQDILDYME